jgi:hypothetical protein
MVGLLPETTTVPAAWPSRLWRQMKDKGRNHSSQFEAKASLAAAQSDKTITEQLDSLMSPENSWRVFLNEKNKLRWESSAGIVSSQPTRNFGQWIADLFYGLLPIENQL